MPLGMPEREAPLAFCIGVSLICFFLYSENTTDLQWICVLWSRRGCVDSGAMGVLGCSEVQ